MKTTKPIPATLDKLTVTGLADNRFQTRLVLTLALTNPADLGLTNAETRTVGSLTEAATEAADGEPTKRKHTYAAAFKRSLPTSSFILNRSAADVSRCVAFAGDLQGALKVKATADKLTACMTLDAELSFDALVSLARLVADESSSLEVESSQLDLIDFAERASAA